MYYIATIININILLTEVLGFGTTKKVACAFDGAANMRSDDVGIKGRLKETDEDIVYTWCYNHILSLGMTTSTICTTSAVNLFGFLQSTCTFASASYKRVLEWEKLTGDLKGHEKLLRLESLSKTRWYSKETSLIRIFGSFSKPNTDIFLVLLIFLHHIKTNKNHDPKARFEASSLLENWLKMDVILTAFVFLKIYDCLGHLSSYLQTKGIDMLAALTMAQTAISKVAAIRDSFEEIKSQAVEFAIKVNANMNIDDDDLFVQEEIPSRRIGRKKRLPGELMDDDPIMDVWKNYKANQFLVICNTTSNALRTRFTGQNELLMKEMNLFHPKQFENIESATLDFFFVTKVLQLDEAVLVRELKAFASIFHSLRNHASNSSVEDIESGEQCNSEEEYDSDAELKKCVSSKKECYNCIHCCFVILCKYNLHVTSFSNLYRVYEYFMTLPCTQVTCECTFSKLKMIKNRLRSAIGQNLLESLLLMYVERELTHQIDVNDIVQTFALSSKELKRNLTE